MTKNKSYRSWWVIQLWYSWPFQLKSFSVTKSCLKLSFVEIQNLNCSNFVTWSNDQNKSCTYRWALQLSCWWIFHLKSVLVPKLILKICILWNSNFDSSNELLWRKDRYKSSRSRWVIQFVCWWLFHEQHIYYDLYFKMKCIYASKRKKKNIYP